MAINPDHIALEAEVRGVTLLADLGTAPSGEDRPCKVVVANEETRIEFTAPLRVARAYLTGRPVVIQIRPVND